ncbi:hypothetical protein HK101_010676 [Irineochytrium annulatum]|nr:hypothetical protein HK101_010676 [Irineochytrium annulatum]
MHYLELTLSYTCLHRFKNKLTRAQVNVQIEHLKTSDFDEGDRALQSLKNGTTHVPKTVVPSATKEAILKKAKAKFHAQRRKGRRLWDFKALKHLLEVLGYTDPHTGLIINPDDYSLDRQVLVPVNIP